MATAKKSIESINYGDDAVNVMDGLEAIRKQSMDMYVGGKDTASFHLVKEVVDNSIDEVLNGYASRIWVTYFPKLNKIVIEDNGRGLPTGMNSKLKKPTIEVLFTMLHAGGKFNKDAFKVSGGKNGVGVKATNALSSDLLVESFRDGEHYTMKFSRGKVVEQLKKVGTTKKRGTKISFVPDEDVLGEFAIINQELLKQELNQRTYINAGLVIELTIDKETTTYVHENGIEDFLNDMNKDPMTDIIGFEFGDDKGNEYQVVFNYANGTGETIRSFVNGIATSKGTHETGFKTGLTNAMTDFIKTNNLVPKKLDGLEIKGEDIREGLFAVLTIKHLAPQFKGQVKDELSNTDVLGELRKVTQEQTSEWLNENPEIAKKIANRIVAFAKGRKDANAIKDKIVKVSSGSSGLSFDENFADSDSRDLSKNEIIIIEGKSAGGNVKEARDANIQAVFPLRGKPLNSYAITNARLLGNKEFRELIKVLFGTTDLKEIVVKWRELIRYGKIVILADADDDGYHIVCLLLTFFYKYFREIIEEGYVYIALSPLYRITKNGKFIYFKNDVEYDKFIVKEIGTKYNVQDIKLSKFIVTGHKYIEKFNLIKSKHHLDKDVLNTIENYYSVTGSINSQDIIDTFKEMGLTVDETVKGQLKVEGLHNDIWHNFIIDKYFEKDIKILSEIFPDLDIVTLEDKKTGNVQEELYIYDALNILNTAVKFERVRFKGLGEADADELFETTLDPQKRDMLRVQIEDVEEADGLTKILFGNNADLRKDFIIEHL
jgi:DNA gyrase subunit B